jgi:ferredoxin-NADP reductase
MTTTHEVRLRRTETVARGTMAFHFDKPAGFAFKPGQAIDIVLPDAADAAAEAGRHTFSLVSAPFEDELVVATRMRDSAFKRALASLAVGSRVRIEGPFGSLTLHNDPARPAVFIAGGIGITPFVSMLRQAANDRRAQRLALVYSNRRPEDAAFLGELAELEQRNGNFRLVATMTDMARSEAPWNGERRRIDAELVEAIAAGDKAPIYYVAGPPAMVAALRETLNRAGVDDDDIRSEEFFGY